MNYIDVFKQIIKEEVSKSIGDKKFIDNLFNQINRKISVRQYFIIYGDIEFLKL